MVGEISLTAPKPIEAIPEEGYSFISWFGHEVADINSPQTTVIITEDISLSAIFAINQHTITITSSTGGTTTGQESTITEQRLILTQSLIQITCLPGGKARISRTKMLLPL